MTVLQMCFVVYGYKTHIRRNIKSNWVLHCCNCKNYTSVRKLLEFEILLNILTNPRSHDVVAFLCVPIY